MRRFVSETGENTKKLKIQLQLIYKHLSTNVILNNKTIVRQKDFFKSLIGSFLIKNLTSFAKYLL